MRKFFLFLMAMVLICPAVSLQAQSGDSDRPQISDADRAAVAAYNEATTAVSQKMREARRQVREKNSELAKVLGREGADYKEQDVIAAHQALTGAYKATVEAELEGLLLYKAYHPEWKPEDDGRRVAIPTGRGQAGDDDDSTPKEEAREKK